MALVGGSTTRTEQCVWNGKQRGKLQWRTQSSIRMRGLSQCVGWLEWMEQVVARSALLSSVQLGLSWHQSDWTVRIEAMQGNAASIDNPPIDKNSKLSTHSPTLLPSTASEQVVSFENYFMNVKLCSSSVILDISGRLFKFILLFWQSNQCLTYNVHGLTCISPNEGTPFLVKTVFKKSIVFFKANSDKQKFF